jgi:tyrosyl-tRNA synthetase
MESGEGMAISEFSYPLFQAYDWWHMYKEHGVQLQIGGSDQYGNICAGMDAVGHMRWLDVAGALGTKKRTNEPREDESRKGTFGITTPLLTTASGEKFGKSAGNAVWLDQEMMSSFDLYQVCAPTPCHHIDIDSQQYFLKTADNDVERYLKLFTFLPLEQINLLMGQQRNDESRRVAQHVLAKEIVELAHGANAAKQAEAAHAEAFSLGTNTFSLSALRKSMARIKASTAYTPSKAPAVTNKSSKKHAENAQALSEYKRSFAAPLTAQAQSGTAHEQSKSESQDMVTLPLSLLQPGSFPRVLHAAGLASSRSDANRLIASKGAYVVVPNSGSTDVPTALQWINIEASATANPSHFLVDWDALVLRSGKSKIKICRILTDDQFETEGLTCPGWEEIQKKRDEAKRSGQVEKSEGV